jgi:hypothetical protein
VRQNKFHIKIPAFHEMEFALCTATVAFLSIESSLAQQRPPAWLPKLTQSSGTKYLWEMSSTSRENPSKPLGPPEKPNFESSGKLLEDTNTVNGVVLKYVQPSDQAKPDKKWRLHVFKGDEQIGTKLTFFSKEIVHERTILLYRCPTCP